VHVDPSGREPAPRITHVRVTLHQFSRSGLAPSKPTPSNAYGRHRGRQQGAFRSSGADRLATYLIMQLGAIRSMGALCLGGV